MTKKIIPDIVNEQTIHELSASDTARDAAKMMTQAKVSAVVITENGKLIGIATERDITQRIVAEGLDPDTTRIEAVMTRNPDTLGPDDSPLSALELMRVRGYRHLPVVDGEKVVGIVSIRDLYDAANSQLAEDIRQREAFIFDTGYGAGT